MEDGLLNRKIAFIIQARMDSTRFPGKILMPLPLGAEKPLLGWVIETLKKSKFNYSIIIATSTSYTNDELEVYCKNEGVLCFRGSEDNVLSRFTGIIRENQFDIVVRLTGDNPIIDIDILDKTILNHWETGADYTVTKGMPLGMNFEVVSSEVLMAQDSNKLKEEEKEHVTLHLRKSGRNKINLFRPLGEREYGEMRLTVDYPSDYLVISSILTVGMKMEIQPGMDLIDYCISNYPWIFEVNNQNHQKGSYDDLQEELAYAKPLLKKYGFKRLLAVLENAI